MLDKKKVREIAGEFAARVRENHNPKSIILFGSYVNGNPSEYSDIDIAVIFERIEENWMETWKEIIGIAWDVDVTAGIEPHMLDETCNRSGFLDHIKKTGEYIYNNIK